MAYADEQLYVLCFICNYIAYAASCTDCAQLNAKICADILCDTPTELLLSGCIQCGVTAVLTCQCETTKNVGIYVIA